MNALHWRVPLLALCAALLACTTVESLVSLAGPEDAATDAVGPLAPATPALTPPLGPDPTPQAGPGPTAQPTLAADYLDLGQFQAAMRPEFRGDVAPHAMATRYVLDVTVVFNADGSATLSGRQRVRYVNRQAAPLQDLVFMLWPNHERQYLSDLTLRHVRLAGAEVRPALLHDGLAARIELPAPLAPGAEVEVATEFVVNAYPGIDQGGAARFGLTHDVLLAPTFYPLIPRIVDGVWQTTPAPPGGDTTNSDTALYVWRVTAPADLAIVATGTVVDTTFAAGRQMQTLVTGPVRDLALVVGPLELTQRQVDGVALNAYLLAEDAVFADDMLDFAQGQMDTLQALVGPYPFAELDLVDAPGAFGGIEYPGLIFVGVVGGSAFFEQATVHEVGHQWFYSLVGDDQLLEPWLDEAAASYTQVLYMERIYGRDGAEDLLSQFWDNLGLSDHPDLPVGLAVADYPSPSDYGILVYSKGALFFDALRRELGDEVFFAFLRAYFAAHRYGFATARDFQSVAEETCTCDLGPLFDLWVYQGGSVTRP